MMKQRRKRWASALIAMVLMLGFLSSCTTSGGIEAGNSEDLVIGTAEDYEEEVIRLVNEIRTREGLPQLTTNSNLSKAAALRAEEIVIFFAHTRPDLSSWFTVLDEFGISNRTAGENAARGCSTPSEVVDAWMNSPGHRDNILDPEFKSMGVGYVSGRGTYGHYWVQLFIG